MSQTEIRKEDINILLDCMQDINYNLENISTSLKNIFEEIREMKFTQSAQYNSQNKPAQFRR